MFNRNSCLPALAAVALSVAIGLAADVPNPAAPKSPAALAAIARHERALADASKAYELARKDARDALLADLKKAQAEVLKAGGPAALAEANAIQAVMDRAPADPRPAAEPPRPAAPVRPAFVGRKYKWTDPQFGNRGWFTLKDDNTVVTGWHDREGVWGVRNDGMIVAGIQGNGGKMVLRPSADGKSLVWAGTGKAVELMN